MGQSQRASQSAAGEGANQQVNVNAPVSVLSPGSGGNVSQSNGNAATADNRAGSSQTGVELNG
jgi:hypothetical protein